MAAHLRVSEVSKAPCRQDDRTRCNARRSRPARGRLAALPDTFVPADVRTVSEDTGEEAGRGWVQGRSNNCGGFKRTAPGRSHASADPIEEILRALHRQGRRVRVVGRQ